MPSVKEHIKEGRIRGLTIPIEYTTALKLIELGAGFNITWKLDTRENFSGTCEYYPMLGHVTAINGMFMATNDELALEVIMLPTVEARREYLKSIDYGRRGNFSYWD